MKNILYTALCLFVFQTETLQSQVMGINTENPTRAVDVNGKARITTGENKANLIGISHILVADSEGNI